jgi:hypothetical protein
MPKKKADSNGTPKLTKPRARKPRGKAGMQPVFPVDEVVKMSDIERLSVGKVDAELANLLQAIRIHDLEGEKLAREHAASMQTRAAHRAQLIAAFEAKKREHEQTVKDVAQRYDLDPSQFTYDPESGVLHDIRNKPEATG